MLVVGGVSAETVGDWRDSPVHGFGIGSSLYKPGMTPEEVGRRARAFATAMRDRASARVA